MKYLVFDCHSFCWRAFHSTGAMSYEGQATGVIYGFLSQVLIHSRQFGINKPIFAWDSKKRYRSRHYAGYKVRNYEDKTPAEQKAYDDAVKQISILREEILPVLGFNNSFIQTGVEADDIIAIFVRNNPQKSIVLTNDDDLLQLTDDCTWHSPQRKLTVNKHGFFVKYGIPPKQWAMAKQIAGCKSDCVPGIDGIGEVYALQYIKKEMKTDSVRYNNIRKGMDIIERNKLLVTLPHPKTKKITLQKDEFNIDGLLAVCDIYGLNKLAEQAGEWKNHFGRF